MVERRMCERGRWLENQATRGSMYWGVNEGTCPLLSLQSSAHAPQSLHGVYGIAQDFQHFGVVSAPIPVVDFSNAYESSNFSTKPRGVWCLGLPSDALREYSFLFDKNGSPASDSKLGTETSVDRGAVVVRSLSCPWSSAHVENTNRIAATDQLRFQKILADCFTVDSRRQGRGSCCKYCSMLEKNLTMSLDLKEKRADENWETMNFKQVDQLSERNLSFENPDSRKRKYELENWENDRALVLLKITELNNRATRAEQRVLELEQLLRDHALIAPDDGCVDSDILTPLPQHECFEERAELLVCKLPGCNKPFKSSKTLRRHVVQKHSDNARFLVCNQPTVNGVMCRFETIHSGVLSYHRKHSLAHQRREDWHISCPFCQSKFARQHEMDRHQRICKSRPVPQLCNEFQTLNGSLSEGLDVSEQLQSFRMPSHSHLHHHQHLHVPESNESGVVASRLMIPGGHLLETDSASTTLF